MYKKREIWENDKIYCIYLFNAKFIKHSVFKIITVCFILKIIISIKGASLKTRLIRN